jgi:hypothetical protein
MENTTAVQSIMRSTARQCVIESVTERAGYEHRSNYHKLHIRRDGSVNWLEIINKSDDIIDDQADHFRAVRSVACVGTGSFACNCDFCSEVYHPLDETLAIEAGRKYDRAAKYDSVAEAITEAISNSDLTGIEADMLAEFDAIPAGYFDDEEADAA